MKLFKKKQEPLQLIRINDKIIVDSGILGTGSGTLKSIDGFSAMGWVGTYEDESGRLRNFDQFCQTIKLAQQTKEDKDE